MSAELTDDSLRIFWNGDELRGITAYGYWRGDAAQHPPFPLDLWPAGAECKPGSLHGPGWRVLLWDVRVPVWPAAEAWERVLEGTLQALCAAGARVAWCGVEGCFADPPGLFSPEDMSGGVWAALVPGRGFRCSAKLGGTYRALTDRELVELRELL